MYFIIITCNANYYHNYANTRALLHLAHNGRSICFHMSQRISRNKENISIK